MPLDEYEPLRKVLNTISQSNDFDGFDFASSFGRKDLSKGDVFTAEGEVPREIGFVVKGIVKYYYPDRDGNEWIKHFSVENDFVVSYGSFIYQKPSMYYIEAIEATRLYTMTHHAYVKLIETSKQWSDIARRLTENIYYQKEIREATFLKMDGTARYLNFLEAYQYLVGRISVKEMASFLGLNHVSLSRIRNTIRKGR